MRGRNSPCSVFSLFARSVLGSPTAEHVFADWDNVETDAAGISVSAQVVLSPEQLDWATIIFVMEKSHRNKLSKKYKKYLNGKRVICLNIPDDYDYMDPVLVRLLTNKVGPFLKQR